MNNILQSPAGLVFIIMAVALVGALFLDKISGDQFLTLCAMAFAFYFVTPSTPGGIGGVK